jgi:hypothetical protein
MQRSFAHKDPQFAVKAKFDSFSALKHACTHAALLDDYEFVPTQVNSQRYRLKCKDNTCSWTLYATGSDASSFALRQVRWALHIVVLCLVLMGLI